MRSILFYNVYLINNWRQISNELLDGATYDTLVVNINFDLRYIFHAMAGYFYFKRKLGADRVYLTENNAQLGESTGLKKFLCRTDFERFDVLTYCHSKGVTKPTNRNDADWRGLMKYFVLDRIDLTEKAFNQGYKLYGVNLCQYDRELGERKYAYKFSDFWFRGTFVSVNLNLVREKLITAEVDTDFYGVEGFWGKLCSFEEAYCPHNSEIDHYNNPYPEELYVEELPKL